MPNTNLRDLLGVVTTAQIQQLAEADVTTKVPPYPSKDYTVMYIAAHCGATCDNWTSNYGYFQYPDWKVPANTTEVIFEIWGAGGSGGDSRCCGRGIPGSSRAYAYKKLTGSDVVPGCSYSIDIGQGGRARNNLTCGQKGGDTYITGYGLSNFCAVGGDGGCSCCYMCCCFWMTKCTVCCNGPCALYYGADGGAYGNPGAGYMFCQNNHCHNKQYIAYPGGLVNGKGGWLPMTQCAHRGCGYCSTMWAAAQLQWGGAYSEGNYIPGIGGASGWTDGGCCYGQHGYHGLVRISYKQSECSY